MKLRFIALGSVLACALLAACGGGGSSGGPNPLPSVTPTHSPGVTYASKIEFFGALAGTQVQSDLRRAESVSPNAAGALIPIMVVSEPEAGAGASFFGGQVEAVVSPQPASTPAVTFAETDPDAVLSTPNPNSTPGSAPAGVVGEATVSGSNNVQSQSSGTATATIGDPVNESPTAPVYSYMSVALDCGPGPGGVLGAGYATHFGWKWSGSTWTPDDNAADADVYVDGPSCVSANSAESAITVNIPGGDVRETTDSPFSSVLASQWTSVETSFTIQQAIQQNGDGSNNGLVIGKTRGGSVTFKLFPNILDTSNGYFGAIEVAGDSVDGF